MALKNRITVTCALIIRGDEVLAAQRSSSMRHPLKWEFPGGKTEPGEDAEACIRREIREELGIEILILGTLPPVEHNYADLSLTLMPFLCRWESGEIRLREHLQVRWLKPGELTEPDWADADVEIVEHWKDWLNT